MPRPLSLVLACWLLCLAPGWTQQASGSAEATDATTASTTDAGATDSESSGPAQLTPGTPPPAVERLRVGVAGNAPFVLEGNEGNAPQGFAVDLWQSLAREVGYEYDLQPFEDVSAALAALETGQLDAVVGPVSITAEREERLAFTQPFFISSFGLLSTGDSLWGRVKPFFTWKFFVALAVFLLILGVVGTLVWLTERKSGAEPFENGPVRGIGNGLWLALVTMTTVGYGDLAPRTVRGRVVLGAWMVVALLSATSLLAGLASTLTQAGSRGGSVETAEDLERARVAVIGEDGPARTFVREHGGEARGFGELDQAIQALKSEDVKAVVFDRPQLRYYLNHHATERDLGLASAEYRPQGYGFAFAIGSDLRKPINVALLAAQADGELKDLEEQWLGSEQNGGQP